MKIIIAGAGKIGSSVAEILSKEGHDITLIDENPQVISNIASSLDVICIQGSAANPEVLLEAGAREAGLFIAATEMDEINMLCGMAASKLGSGHVIARIRDPQYIRQTDFLRDVYGLSFSINPEYECAREISRILRFPGAVRVETFSKGRLEIAECPVAAGSPLEGIPLKELDRKAAKVLVSVVDRGRKAIIPNGDFTIQAGDILSVAGSNSELRKFFEKAGEYRKPVKSVMLAGGGRTSVYLAELLLESGMSVRIVEKDREMCSRICELVPKAAVICGDLNETDVFSEEGISDCDAFVSLTGDDGDNIVAALYAKSCGVKKIVSTVNQKSFSGIIRTAGIDTIVSPSETVTQQICRYVRAMDNTAESSVETLYYLVGGEAEALEYHISESTAFTDIPLKNLKLRPNVLIAAIIRGNGCIIPDGNSVINTGDNIVVICNFKGFNNPEDMLEG